MTSPWRMCFSWLLKAHTGLVEGMPKLLDNPQRMPMYWKAGMGVAVVVSLTSAATVGVCLRWLGATDFSQQSSWWPRAALLLVFAIIPATIVLLSAFLQLCCKPADGFSADERLLMGMEPSQPLTPLERWLAVHVLAPEKQRLHRAWLLTRCLPPATAVTTPKARF